MEIKHHSLHSRYRERVAEHLFLGELLGHAWAKGRRVEVLRAETDSRGYDVALECGSTIRHVQLKGVFGANEKFSIAEELLNRPSGCVVVIMLTRDAESLRVSGYRYFALPTGMAMTQYLNGRMLIESAKKVELKLSAFSVKEPISLLCDRLFPKEFADVEPPASH